MPKTSPCQPWPPLISGQLDLGAGAFNVQARADSGNRIGMKSWGEWREIKGLFALCILRRRQQSWLINRHRDHGTGQWRLRMVAA